MTTYNTGNPVGSTDARDLYDNAQNLDNFSNGTALTYPDRLGVLRRSLAGIDATADSVLNAIGYAVPVAYTAGISLTLTSQTVEYNNEIYAPLASALPFTTSGTFETAKFRLMIATDASRVNYIASGTSAVATTVQSKLRETVSVKDFGAVGDGETDDTDEINAAATYCRTSGAKLVIPAVSSFYLISSTVDFSEIKNIDGQGAELRGTFSGTPAAVIGGASTAFRGAEIYLKVRNTPDQSAVAGTHGIKMLNMSNSRLTLFSRGFLNGIYFDGNSGANRVWVDNRIDVLELYNNKNQVHFDLAGLSYAVKNQFVGGSYFTGDITPTAASGTFKFSLAGSGLVSDTLVQSPEIGIVRSGIDLATHGVFVYADVATTWDVNTIEFVDTRFEGYGTWGSDNPYAVNIAINTSGRLGVSVEFSGSMTAETAFTRFLVFQPEIRPNRIRISNKAIRSQGSSIVYPQTIIPDEVVPYQTVDRCYIPWRVIYDNTTGYNVPVDFLSFDIGSNRPNRANGDGDLISSTTTNSYGLIYTKTVGDVLFLELHKTQQVAVVCFDASGNVLSGTAPWYAQGESLRSVTRGSVTIYEFNGRWLWLHKDVASFYIGAARWTSAGKLEDIRFDVLYGRPIDKLNSTKMSPRNNVANVSPAQTFMPLGSEMTGTSANGWRNTFYLRTTTSAGAASGATAINLSVVTGITGGDTIGIELDTEIATGLRRYQYTTVSSVVGSTVNLSAALVANVAAGRTILVNRWVAK
jgi:hypothetical protein